ncbi:MAG: hypothetical protein KC619_26300, partial [Myxococcales bacterium]|nr:hypothetical protein [Myxococcales bacterium]
MAARVDVWDPTPEGEWIVENLRQSALEVRSVDLADVPVSEADIVLMAGDVVGALGALKLLRDEGDNGDVPVILLGIPAGMAHPGDGPGFGAEAVFERPVEFAPLLARVFRLIESSARAEVSRVQLPIPERTMELSDPDDPDSSQVLLRPADQEPSAPWRPREPTMRLAGSAEVSEVSAEVSKVTGRTPRSEPPSTTSSGRGRLRDPHPSSGSVPISSYPGTGSVPGSDPSFSRPEVEIPPERRTTLSPWLSELFLAADRRVFPDRPPIALHLPAADHPPEELVPAELFEVPSLPIDEPMVEDPIDAFTYVGGPAVPPPIQSGTSEDEIPTAERELGSAPSSLVVPVRRIPTVLEAPRVEVTTRTELPPLETSARARGGDWPEDDTVLGRPTPDGDRHGSLGPGGALRLLWRVAALGLDTIAELSLDDGATVRLTYLGGTPRAFDGPIAGTVLEGLRRRGRATERPADEAGAEAALQKRVDAGLLGRFERDRLMREARERLLVRVVGAEHADFVLRRLDDTQPGRVLARAHGLKAFRRAALVEVARSCLVDKDLFASEFV